MLAISIAASIGRSSSEIIGEGLGNYTITLYTILELTMVKCYCPLTHAYATDFQTILIACIAVGFLILTVIAGIVIV